MVLNDIVNGCMNDGCMNDKRSNDSCTNDKYRYITILSKHITKPLKAETSLKKAIKLEIIEFSKEINPKSACKQVNKYLKKNKSEYTVCLDSFIYIDSSKNIIQTLTTIETALKSQLMHTTIDNITHYIAYITDVERIIKTSI